MKKSKKNVMVLGLILVALIFAAGYYYVTLPALNIHEKGFWGFLISLLLLILLAYVLRRKIKYADDLEDIKANKGIRIGCGIIVVSAVIFAVGWVLSSPIVNAGKYRELITIENRDFTEDIKTINYSQIPLLDKDSAVLLGNRKMGSMVDMVSQFEVSNLYSQINYQEKPVRVTPLVYASTIKWLTNHVDGIPAYMMIDMTTQDTKLVKLDQSIRYSQSELFNRKIERHLRFRYPTYMFSELSFEIDDEGVPYWICPVKDYTIGLFGGETIGRVVVCNAITGETADYKIEDCPQWIDRVFPADMLLKQYNYYGELVHGYLNSILSQRGCLMTTEGYNYLAMEDDVWVYTGITSVSGDESNVGFILANQRTHEVRYYEVNGAEEYSAMESAQGQVQHLGYTATFPLLINIANEPTYFMALKDDAGLVKMYAMVNIQKYQNVAIGDTVAQCEKAYIEMLDENGISTEGSGTSETIHGKIARIAQTVVSGNSRFYFLLEDSELIFEVSFVDHKDAIRYEAGDQIGFRYVSGDDTAVVLEIIK